MTNKIYNKIENSEQIKKYFWSMFFVLVLCFLSYGYFVSGAIMGVVERQNAEKDISALNSKVIELESKYLKLKNNITLERALDLGYIAPDNQKFVTKDVKNPGLSLLTSGQ